ncbi:TIGR01459 family HAD-type hydrolase [Azospirillaceae bacterium]
MTNFKVLPGLASVAEHYDGFILDLWGVLHDGERACPGVEDCLKRLLAIGKKVCLLSNAPRRNQGVVEKLNGMGLTPDFYNALVTSGEATREALQTPSDDWHRALGARCLHIGPDRDRDVMLSVSRLIPVTDVEQADFLLNSGPVSYDDLLEDYDPLLQRAVARGLPMVCANPDLEVMVGARRVICAGALAQRYECFGGSVRSHGKPYPEVYRRCSVLMGDIDGRRLLAIGDSLRTDVAGAVAAGIDAALVVGGIHLERVGGVWGDMPDAARLAAFIDESPVKPHIVLPRLVW